MSVDAVVTEPINLQNVAWSRSEASSRPTLSDVVIRATAIALRVHPRVNGSFSGDHVETYSRVSVAFAVATHEAVLAPGIFDADETSLQVIARSTKDLARRARDSTIMLADLQGPPSPSRTPGGMVLTHSPL